MKPKTTRRKPLNGSGNQPDLRKQIESKSATKSKPKNEPDLRNIITKKSKQPKKPVSSNIQVTIDPCDGYTSILSAQLEQRLKSTNPHINRSNSSLVSTISPTPPNQTPLSNFKRVNEDYAVNQDGFKIKGFAKVNPNSFITVEVSNLHPETTHSDLQQVFKGFGKLEKLVVKDFDGMFSGRVLVTYSFNDLSIINASDVSSGLAVIDKLHNKLVDGRVIQAVHVPNQMSILGSANASKGLFSEGRGPSVFQRIIGN